jgi:3-oxoacyl-[acyl-carrier-protein] synthase II
MSTARPASAAQAGSRRVAVTGVGAVSGFGLGAKVLWEGLRAGSTAIRPLSRFDSAAHRTHLAAEVPALPSLAPPSPRRRRQAADAAARDDRELSVTDRFALAAAAEALAQAGLGAGPLTDADAAPPVAAIGGDGAICGVFFASSTGGMWESEDFLAGLLGPRAGRRLDSLHALASQQVSGPGDAVARHFQVTGPVQTVSSACASGGLAIGAALEAVRSGEVDLALTGGADSLCQLTYAGFNSLRAIDEDACRPFRAGRGGMSFGEGAAVLVLEPLERALARGCVPLALVAGAGAACDAFHMTAPDPEGTGAALAIAAALADAGLGPDDIDFVNAHATGTTLNDTAEWRALARVFGERAGSLPVCASKAGIGHLLGASGAIEAVITVLSLLHGELHPVPAAAAPLDDACPVALVIGKPLRLAAARAALSTSLAFGGSNAALVFARWAGAAA